MAPNSSRSQLEHYVWVALAAWTIVVGSSLASNMVQARKDMLELARIQACISVERDVLYRRWNMIHDPVYVAETQETPPNPHLSQVQERDIATPSGTRLTMVNPAYMTRQVHEMGNKESGIRGHITSLKPRRIENAPDPWETEALKAFEQGRKEVSTVQKMDGVEYMRLMTPLVTEAGCLRCHADQGYREGDIRGGISAAIPMSPLRAVERRHMSKLLFWHGVIWLIGVTGIVLAGRRLRASRDAIEMRNLQLEQSGHELQEAHDLLDGELRSVGDVQISLLPTSLPEIPGFEMALHYRPAKRAGGDYLDLFPLPDNRCGVLVADVCSHGAAAAVVMAMMHTMLHGTNRKAPAEEVLRYLNDALSSVIPAHQFVTCCYGILDPPARTFSFASAGHPPPMLFDPANGQVEVLKIMGALPLGINPTEQYSASSITLEPNSLLLLYTDGIMEAFNAEREPYGLARLASVLEAHGAGGPERVRQAILADLDNHCGAVELADDTALIVLKALRRGDEAV